MTYSVPVGVCFSASALMVTTQPPLNNYQVRFFLLCSGVKRQNYYYQLVTYRFCSLI